ncbi:MAG: zinc-ribbon domain-containing protein [Deltaproteobacteria bacterium]|nr:zinc-ribbon domain-containing protein [Deltaproteobacteria bacterium]
MDVTCDRCNTRYEFDEALVSNRGTTVKCTSCGHQFKVYRAKDAVQLEGWTVRTVDGREIYFKAMRELQAAIHGRDVTPDDVLIPGDGGEPRRLGKIEELESFFAAPEGPEMPTIRRRAKGSRGDDISMSVTKVAGSSSPSRVDRAGAALPSRTGDTLRPPPTSRTPPVVTIPKPPSPPSEGWEDTPRTRKQPKAKKERGRAAGSAPAKVSTSDVDSGWGSLEVESPPIPEAKPSASTAEAVEALHEAVNAMFADKGKAPEVGAAAAKGDQDSNDDEPTDRHRKSARYAKPHVPSVQDEDTLGEEDWDDEPETRRRDDPELADTELADTAAGTPKARRLEMPSEHPDIPSVPPLTPTPSAARPSILRRSDVYSDPRFSTFGPRGKRPGIARWVVGLIGVGLLGVVGFTLFKRYAMPPAAESTPAASQEDPRVTKLVTEGDELLAAGDIDGAKDQYTRASGIAEANPRVATGLARIEVVRADLLWLHMRLLGDDAPNRSTVGQQLSRAVRKAKEAAAAAATHAPDDPAILGLQIDVLRLEGKAAAARKLVDQLDGSTATGGRVLATLDLLDGSPNFGSVIDRLGTAVTGEKKLGRARALLIYALARAGKKQAATEALAELKSENAAHPLLDALARYVESAEEVEEPADAGVEADAGDDDGDDDDDDPNAIPADFREALRRGHAARQRGDLEQAERLYRAALDKSPGNSEALTGLADVARERGDSSSAAKRYEEMLANNPGYLPALVGLADIKWSSGQRGAAVTLYRQVVQAAPNSSYGEHAQTRIDAHSGGAQPPPPPPKTAEPKVPPVTTGSADTTDLPAPPASTSLPPGIDTSDLPEE